MRGTLHRLGLGLLLCFAPLTASAATAFYTFSGTITDFNDLRGLGVSSADYGIIVGETMREYVFAIDLERSRHVVTNSAATWDYFWCELLSPEIVTSPGRDIEYSGFVSYWDSYYSPDRSALNGGSSVRVTSYETDTPNWRIWDWEVGQVVRLVDSAFIDNPAGIGVGGVINFQGDFTLVSIQPVPEPRVLAFGFSGACLTALRRRRRSEK